MKTTPSKTIYRCCLQTVTPVHIGCDEVYEPTSFTVDETRQHLVAVSPLAILQSLSTEERQRFSAICARGDVGSILDIYKFLRNRSIGGRTVAACADFIEHYRRTLRMTSRDERRVQQELNKFEIPRTAFRSVDGRAYIPGSSIKGALRTAYLNAMEQARQLAVAGKPFKDAMRLQQALLDYRNIPGDPFRCVKVSDFQPVGPIATKIVYAVNKKKNPGNRPPRGMPLLMEVILPGATFIGQISVETPHPAAGIETPIHPEVLVDAARHFFNHEWHRESSELAQLQIPTQRFEIPSDAWMLRCGRHSGAESVTIQGHRSIKILGKKGERPRISDRATTFWLVSESRNAENHQHLAPFGWSVFAPLTSTMAQQCEAAETAYLDSFRVETAEPVSASSKMPAETQTISPPVDVEEPPASAAAPQAEQWDKASLTWDAGSKTLTAVSKGRKATAQDRTLVPEPLQPRLFKKGKKKAVTVTVKVQPIGNRHEIIAIEER